MSAIAKRPLGKTGIDVSTLSLGCAGLGGVYGDTDEQTGIEVALRAFELGITTFDTSPYYGKTRSETVLGKAIAQLPRDEIVVMTKCGRYGPEEFDFSQARIEQSCEESLRRLQTDHVDVLFLHDVEFGDLARILDESVPALCKLKEQGKARAIGITGLPLSIFRRAIAQHARIDAILSYCHATLFDDSLVTLLPECDRAGIGIVNGSPTSMGVVVEPRPATVASCGRGDEASLRRDRGCLCERRQRVGGVGVLALRASAGACHHVVWRDQRPRTRRLDPRSAGDT